MSRDPLASDFKKRAETQFINELSNSQILRAMKPRRQTASQRIKKPYVVVIVVPGKELSPGARIRRSNMTIELFFDAKKEGQSVDDMETAANEITTQMARVQAEGLIGVVDLGEYSSVVENETTRKRVFAYQIVAG